MARIELLTPDVDANGVSEVMPSIRGGMVAEKSTVGRRDGEDRVDVVAKFHVEHLVGLVEHDDLEAVQGQVPGPMWSSAR